MLQPREPGAVTDAGGGRSGACVAHGGELGRSSAFFLFFPHGLATSVALHVHPSMTQWCIRRSTAATAVFSSGNTFFHSTNGDWPLRVERQAYRYQFKQHAGFRFRRTDRRESTRMSRSSIPSSSVPSAGAAQVDIRASPMAVKLLIISVKHRLKGPLEKSKLSRLFAGRRRA